VDAPVGLIAGQGRFPIEVARSIRSRGRRVRAAALRRLALSAIEPEVDELDWVYLGEIERLLNAFRAAGVREVVMAGKVPKTFLWEHPDALRPDARALQLIAGLADRKDDSMLGAVADLIEEEGFHLLGQAELAPELLVREGPLGRARPDEGQLRDVAFAWPVAKALGRLDVGQTVVVKDRAVLAVEAIEGTDAAIRRGCGLGEEGACVVKVAKPSQDPRFDVPTIGLATVRTLAEGKASLLAVEAGRTVALEREALVAEADARGTCVLGVGAGGPLSGAGR
jgi:DUF1009 family protein